MSQLIAVSGATGALGGMVAAALSRGGVEQRLLVRDASRAPDLEHASSHVAWYEDGPAVARALDGVEVAFMVSAKESPRRLDDHRTFIDAARNAGVKHVVYTSFVGAAADATFTFARDHYATERYLAESGMDVTILRDNFYMDVTPFFPGEDGVIRGPAGTGRAAMVSRADIAASAARVLLDPSPHVARVYEMTGPEALSLADVADALTDALGRSISFQNETIAEAYESRSHYGAEQWEVDAWVSTYSAIATGEMSAVSNDVQQLTGHAPRTLRDVLASTKASE